EHLRRIMPHNMGSLYWQIDDCWPVASWSSIDYYGRWKALQYYARRFYSEILISPRVEEKNLNLYVVSDRSEAVQGQIKMSLMDFDGHVLMNDSKDVTIGPLQSSTCLSIPMSTLLHGRESKNVMLYCELLVGGRVVSTNEYFFDPYKKLSVPKPSIGTDVKGTRDGFKITLVSDKFARAVYLSASGADGFFSDNYFDLLPGKKVEVEFRTRAGLTLADFRSRLKIRSMADAF
ncbi:MAG: glycoside hydrolase family 2 protein, partial [Acidobacteriota bacterium]|nr:glycoside hydrolase family 2 protein [Acidobacteriota bacterium]